MTDDPRTQVDEQGTLYAFAQLVGERLEGAHALGYRSPGLGFYWETMESWVLRVHRDRLVPLYGTKDWLTGIWSGMPDRVWASAIHGAVYEIEPGGMKTHRPLRLASGIWGFASTEIYAWDEVTPTLARYDGDQWSVVECPGKIITLALGPGGDIYAGGYEGLLSRRRGGVWRPVDVELRGNVMAMAGDHARGFACTNGGELAELSDHGAQIVQRWPRPLVDVAVTADDRVLVVDAIETNLEWNGRALEPVTLPVEVSDFARASRGTLTLGGPGVVELTDALDAEQASLPLTEFRELRRHDRPMWKP